MFFIFSVVFTCVYLGVFEYINEQLDVTSIYDDYYVDARDVELKFPDKKRNLIYIYVESLEMTSVSINNGGAVDKFYIPNLESIALENQNFSNTKKLGGAFTPSRTTWTIAAMVSQTVGIPLKLDVSANNYVGYGEFLPGIYSLGDILKDNEYSNYIMMGSDATFGGRRDYFTYHGDYKILDYNWAVEEEKIDEDYYVWWGYEDEKLYQFAKDELSDISKNDEPFNFTLLTADTHFTDGYLGENAQKPFKSKYANSFYNADIMLSEFLEWIKKQDFYDNTTIIITGDHLTRQSDFYSDISSNYDRTVYNCFINSFNETENYKNRIFTTLDMFPTTLSSIGVKIVGDRLGLGTDLYSNTETLAEEMGYDNLNKELSKRSNFYNYNLLENSYFKMKD